MLADSEVTNCDLRAPTTRNSRPDDRLGGTAGGDLVSTTLVEPVIVREGGRQGPALPSPIPIPRQLRSGLCCRTA
jgi:hypothetical protein